MSYFHEEAERILSVPERWVASEGSLLVVIYKERGHFNIAVIKNDCKPYLDETIDNSLWFPTIESAKYYARKHMFVTARFKRNKNN